jgi:long-chain acyl-CoA synthetase
VIGVAGDLLGKDVGAAVIRKRGATATALQTSGYVKKSIAADKYPRQVWCVGQLPKGTTGRILRRKVRAPRTETALS